MMIKLYIIPGQDPNAAADQAKQIVEQMLGTRCNVRVSGPRNTKPNPYITALTMSGNQMRRI